MNEGTGESHYDCDCHCHCDCHCDCDCNAFLYGLTTGEDSPQKCKGGKDCKCVRKEPVDDAEKTRKEEADAENIQDAQHVAELASSDTAKEVAGIENDNDVGALPCRQPNCARVICKM